MKIDFYIEGKKLKVLLVSSNNGIELEENLPSESEDDIAIARKTLAFRAQSWCEEKHPEQHKRDDKYFAQEVQRKILLKEPRRVAPANVVKPPADDKTKEPTTAKPADENDKKDKQNSESKANKEPAPPKPTQDGQDNKPKEPPKPPAEDKKPVNEKETKPPKPAENTSDNKPTTGNEQETK